MQNRKMTERPERPVGPWRAQHLAMYVGGKPDVEVLLGLIDTAADSGFNMLCLNPGRAMRFEGHPELAAEWALSTQQMRQIVAHGRARKLEVVPVLNLMSHGSEILHAYPRFCAGSDEIYHPQRRGLYPLLFDLIDQTLEVFGRPRWLHIGHDEVLSAYDIRLRKPVLGGPARAPRLFAEDVNRLHEHLAGRGVGTMMWADQLLDPRRFAEASFCQAGCYGGLPEEMARSIDRLPRDIVMCDWHYEMAREFPTIRFLQDAGFRTLGCGAFPLNTALFTRYALARRTPRFLGMMVTSWWVIDRDSRATLTRNIRAGGAMLMHPTTSWRRHLVLRRILPTLESAGRPVPAGRARRTYTSTPAGGAVLHSTGWWDLRYREYPRCGWKLHGPAVPSTLDLRAGREGWISYRWDCPRGRHFRAAAIRVWMTNPGGNRIELITESSQPARVLCENVRLRGRRIDLGEQVRGRDVFRLRFHARNDTKKTAAFLSRLELETTTD